MRFNMHEVSEVKWVDIPELAAWMQRSPEQFTPWFLDEARLVGLL